MTTKVTKDQVRKAKLIAGSGPVDVLFDMGLIELAEEEDSVVLQAKIDALDEIIRQLKEELETERQQVKDWKNAAKNYHTNTEYYRDICDICTKIGEIIGPDAYIANDGSKMDDVLVAKLPELVQELKDTLGFEREGIARLQAELKQSRKDRNHWHRAYQRAIEPVWIEKP